MYLSPRYVYATLHFIYFRQDTSRIKELQYSRLVSVSLARREVRKKFSLQDECSDLIKTSDVDERRTSATTPQILLYFPCINLIYLLLTSKESVCNNDNDTVASRQVASQYNCTENDVYKEKDKAKRTRKPEFYQSGPATSTV